VLIHDVDVSAAHGLLARRFAAARYEEATPD